MSDAEKQKAFAKAEAENVRTQANTEAKAQPKECDVALGTVMQLANMALQRFGAVIDAEMKK